MGIRWRDWPQDQQHALTRYLTALWRVTLTEYWHPRRLDALGVLEAAGDLGISVTPYLYDWESRGGEVAALHLAWLIRHGPSRWERNPAEEWCQVIDQWMMGPAPRQVITSALAVASTPEVAANFSGALDILDSWGSRA